MSAVQVVMKLVHYCSDIVKDLRLEDKDKDLWYEDKDLWSKDKDLWSKDKDLDL